MTSNLGFSVGFMRVQMSGSLILVPSLGLFFTFLCLVTFIVFSFSITWQAYQSPSLLSNTQVIIFKANHREHFEPFIIKKHYKKAIADASAFLKMKF